MSQQPSQEALARVTDALAIYQRPTITGAALGILLRKAVPDLDIRAAVNLPVGTGALAKFVDEFLSHLLRRAGQTANDGTGGDNIYEVLSPSAGSTDLAPPSELTGPDLTGHDYWSAFVRPSDKRTILIIESNGEYQLRFAGDADVQQGRPITKVSPEEFKAISEDFLRLLDSNSETAPLASRLRETSSYAAFIQVLREAGNAYFVRWSEHRRDRLRATFLERLKAADFSLPNQQHLLNLLDRSQESTRQELKSKTLARAAEFTSPALPPSSISSESTNQARELLKAIVDRMSTQEIRSLSVPIGHVLDALQVNREKR